MKKDFIFTFATQFFVLISGLLIYKLSTTLFGSNSLAEFALVKRNIAYIYTFILLGLGVALPRFIAIEIGRKTNEEINILLSGLIIVFSSLSILGILFVVFKEEITMLIFADKSFIKYIYPILISIIGLSLHSLVYSFYRGIMIFKMANFIQFLNLGLIPLTVFYFSKNLKDVFLFNGIIICFISSLFIIFILRKRKFDMKKGTYHIKNILTYGFQRLSADFGLASLIALPSIFSAHTYGTKYAGLVAFSISLLNMTGQALAPIGLIILPKISKLMGEKDFVKIKYYVKKLLLFSLAVIIVITTLYQMFAEIILRLYLGSFEPDLIKISKQIMWGAMFYPIYVTFRSVIDAYYFRAYNTLSIISALLSFIIIFYLSKSIILSFVLSLFILSLITLMLIYPLMKK